MKRLVLILALLVLVFAPDKSNAQVSSLPYIQTFEDSFTMGKDVEFLPQWLGNVVAPDTMYQELGYVYAGMGALAMVPQEEEFRNLAKLYLDLTGKSNVAVEFWYASDDNLGGSRYSRLMVAVSIDSGATFFPEVSVEGAHRGLPNERTPYQHFVYALHPAAANQKNVVLQLTGRTGGGSGRHPNEDEHVEEEGGGPSPSAKLLIDDLTVFESDIDSFPPLTINSKVIDVNTLQVTFSEPMDSSAENIEHYQFINNEVMITSAVRDADLDQVTLYLNPSLEIGKYYDLIVSDLYDTAGNISGIDTLEIIYNPLTAGLVITEIFYDEPPVEMRDYLEFIELYNATTEPMPLGGLRIRGGITSHDFPEYTLQPGEYWVIAKDSSAFYNFFGVHAHQWRGANLSNDDPEYLEIVNTNRHSGLVIDSLTYTVGAPWPENAAGLGGSMELCNPFADNSDPANWSNATTFIANYEGVPIYASPGKSCNDNLKPVVNLGYDGDYCGFTQLTLDAGNPGAIYKWSTGATTKTIIITESGKYSVWVNNGYGATFDEIEVAFKPSIEAEVTLPESGQCVEEQLAFADNTSGAVKWLWSFGDGKTSVLQNPVHQYAAAGYYQVTLLVTSEEGCTDVFEQQLEVKGITIDWNIPENPVCTASSINFSASLIAGIQPVVWYWTFGDGTSSSIQNPIHTYSHAGQYDVSLMATSALGCETILTGSISVTDITSSWEVVENQLCTNANLSFVANTDNAVAYQWDFDDGHTSTQQNPQHTYSSPGSYLVKLLVTSANGCTNQSAQAIDVKDYEVSWVIPEDILCPDVMNSFLASADNVMAWNWDFGDGHSSGNQNPSHLYANEGTYNLRLQVTGEQGCSAELTEVIQVSGVTSQWSISESTYCANTVANFNSNTTGSTSWYWNFDDGQSSFEENPSHIFTEEGLYNVTLVVESGNGCMDELTHEIEVKGISSSWQIPQSIICADVPATFFATTVGATSWEWDFGDGTQSHQKNTEHAYTEAGVYKVMLTSISDHGCKDMTEAEVEVSDVEAEWVLPADAVCYQSAISFMSVGEDAVSALWTFGDGAFSDSQHPSHVYNTIGLHTVTLTVVNAQGCTDVLMQDIDVDVCVGIENDWNKMILYPNPITDFVKIAPVSIGSEYYAFRLITTGGTLVKSSLEWQHQGDAIAIDLTGVASGVYILEMLTSNQKVYWQVVKK